MEGSGQGSKGLPEMPRFAVLQASAGEKNRRRVCFGAGSVIQVALVSAFLWLLTLPPAPREDEGPNRDFVLLAPPPEVQPRKAIVAPAPPARPSTQAVSPPQKEAVKIQAPKIELKPLLPRVAPPVTAKLQTPPLPAPPQAPAVKINVPKWKPETHVGAFDSAPAVASVKLPKAEIQTGGFGAADGLHGQAEGGSHGNVPQIGSFDRPEGPGSGNGTGGAHGSPTLVASAGFGSGMAPAGSIRGSGSAGDGQVRSAGFADAGSAAQASPKLKSLAAPNFEPVEITAKPDPVYTAEARSLQIQGEVVVRVVFTAAGRVQVVGVEQGLGHGLDEAAVRAAQQIQFKPARRGGQPVDVTATLHITFQLAN